MRENLLKWIAGIAERRPGTLFLAVLVIRLLAGALSENLKMEMHFKNLMPEDHPMVLEFNRIIDDFSTASMIIVAARGEETELKHFADDLAPKLKNMDKYVQRDTLSEVASHPQEIDSEKVEQTVERLLIGDEYLVSQDKDVLLIFAEPTFTLNEMDQVIEASDSIDVVIKQTAAKYPSIFAGTTGTMALSRDETVAASEDAYFTTLIALVLIILLFILSFRMWVAPLLAGISLIMGVIWFKAFTPTFT